MNKRLKFKLHYVLNGKVRHVWWQAKRISHGWALHRARLGTSKVGRGWCVSHLPSGQRIALAMYYRDAISAFKSLILHSPRMQMPVNPSAVLIQEWRSWIDLAVVHRLDSVGEYGVAAPAVPLLRVRK